MTGINYDFLLSYLSIFKNIINILKYNPNDYIIYHGTNLYNRNWGDQLNRYLLPALSGKCAIIPHKLSGKEAYIQNNIGKIHSKQFAEMKNATIYSAVGSVLGWLHHENSVVWGWGFLHEDNRLPIEPKEIVAVRGPRTSDIINEQYGTSVKVFGDPGVLYTECYFPTVPKKYSLGIIPHYVDYQIVKKRYQNVDDVKIIDIKSGNKKVVDDILSCRHIASSSLHGLIMADAYDIPTAWIDWITPKIDDFKYYDYFESIHCDKDLISLNDYSKPSDIISVSSIPNHKIDMKKLLSVCPFYDKDRLYQWKSKLYIKTK